MYRLQGLIRRHRPVLVIVVAYDSAFSMAFVATPILWTDTFVLSIDLLSTIFDIYDPVALIRYTEM